MTHASDRAPALVPAPVAWGTRGAVVSPHHLATTAGLGILRAGGSGGGCRDRHQRGAGRGRWAIPAAWEVTRSGSSATGAGVVSAQRQRSLRRGRHDRGGDAAGLAQHAAARALDVTVPGAVRVVGRGARPFRPAAWADLLAPAIELARRVRGLASLVRRGRGGAVERYGTDGDWARIYRPDGRPWRDGETVRCPRSRARCGRSRPRDPTTQLHRHAGDPGGGVPRLVRRSPAPRRLRRTPIRLGRPHRDELPRSSRALSHPPNSCGPLALETLNILARFSPPAPERVRWPGRRGRPLGPPRPRGLASRAGRPRPLAHRPRCDGTRRARPPALGRPTPTSSPDASTRIAAAPAAHDAAPREAAPSTLRPLTPTVARSASSSRTTPGSGRGSSIPGPASRTRIVARSSGSIRRTSTRSRPASATLHTLTPGMLLRDGRPWVIHGSMGGEIQPQVFAQVVSALVDGGVDSPPPWPRHAGPPARRRAPRATVTHPDRVALPPRGDRGLRARGTSSP